MGPRGHGHLGMEVSASRPQYAADGLLGSDRRPTLSGSELGPPTGLSRPGYPNRDLNRRDDPTWEPVRRALGFTRQLADRMDLASAVPHNDLASSGYCLANPEREFLVYLPEGDRVEV